MGVRTPEGRPERAPLRSPPAASAVALGLAILLLLLANGRAIESGDTRSLARTAASLVTSGDLNLDEYADVGFPFAREEGGHKVTIYPALPALMAAPVFLAARFVYAFDEVSVAFTGKLAASLFAAAAAAVFFVTLGRRHPLVDARWAAVVLALGTSLWSTSQALWQHPAAVLWLCVALLFLDMAQEDDAWAGRAGLPLALMVAARHADVAIATVIAAAIALRWPRRALALLAWGAPVAAFVAVYNGLTFGALWRHGFSGSLGRFSEPWGVGQLGLLLSPAKGLVVFTPVVIVGLVGLLVERRRRPWMAATLGLAFLAHLVLTGRWREWHGGESLGPRLMTDAVPLLLFFAPEGLAKLQGFGAALAALSIGVQALGAFAYDGRWERLYQREESRSAEAVGFTEHPELWDPIRSPMVFHVARRVVLPAAPVVKDGRLLVREHPMVLFGPKGSRFTFTGGIDQVVVKGADATAGDVHLRRGAYCEDRRLRLAGRWAGLFLRVREVARLRELELRLVGSGRGTLYVGERSFWSGTPRWREYPVSGAFRLRHKYLYADSGGSDILVTNGRDGALVSLESVALVAPGDPEKPLELP
ncbi:MAG TPA: hypothetical protein VFM88_00245 [Vicinamibacteria bacterium]|nr:hypothetical protein [Vicinamibacteria bacterium]